MVLTFDLLVSVPLALMMFREFVLFLHPFRADEWIYYVSMIASFGNVLLDLALIYRIWQYPFTINRVICGLKVITGFLGILTIIPGIYFLVVSASMLNAPPVIPVQRTAASAPGSMTLRDKIRYHLVEIGIVIIFIAGLGIFILGLGIASGNRTGISPTFPFAGYITSFIGTLVIGFSVYLERNWLDRLKW